MSIWNFGLQEKNAFTVFTAAVTRPGVIGLSCTCTTCQPATISKAEARARREALKRVQRLQLYPWAHGFSIRFRIPRVMPGKCVFGSSESVGERTIPLSDDTQDLWEDVYEELRSDKPGLVGAMTAAKGSPGVAVCALSIGRWKSPKNLERSNGFILRLPLP